MGLIENAQTLDEEIDSESQQFIQHSTPDEGERGGVEQADSEDILQNTPKKENESVEVQSKQLSKRWDEKNPFQVGEKIVDILTKIRGTVEAIEGEKVFFYCREFGRVWRHRELLRKMR